MMHQIELGIEHSRPTVDLLEGGRRGGRGRLFEKIWTLLKSLKHFTTSEKLTSPTPIDNVEKSCKINEIAAAGRASISASFYIT